MLLTKVSPIQEVNEQSFSVGSVPGLQSRSRRSSMTTTPPQQRRGWTRELWTLLTLSEAAGVWCWIMKTDYPPTAACQRVMHCDQTRCSHPCPGVTCHVPCHTCQHSHFSDQTWSGAGNNLNKLSFRFWREKRDLGIRMQSLDVAFYWSTAFSNTIPIV